jgi:hypothetical protein
MPRQLITMIMTIAALIGLSIPACASFPTDGVHGGGDTPTSPCGNCV